MSSSRPRDLPIRDRVNNQARYMAMLRAVRTERGAYCEAYHDPPVPATHVHHIIPIRESGINSELVYDLSNVIILCDDDHLLMHPLIRRTVWLTIRRDRGRALQLSG